MIYDFFRRFWKLARGTGIFHITYSVHPSYFADEIYSGSASPLRPAMRGSAPNLISLFWCLYYTKLAPIFKTNDVDTRGARGGSGLNRTLDERSATASLHSATPKRKNVPCFSDLAG